ncbi:MAG: protein-L-isoaspartate(D-aspartate) O-methyltransferase [Dehalococcoidia bacterium]|nr:protein-L-isoaspartate(D-aspartate) O-methyltransferase [Dehalococcoidia bacterium]
MVKLEKDREKLIEHIRREISDERVLNAMARVRRELFIPSTSRHLAYEDRPLPIGEGQTISQPFIVALMTQALELVGTEKVLELGTGSGYQAAILAELAREVITLERLQKLANKARRTLKKLAYTNVQVHLASRTLGWRAEAPYDAIMVTAAAPRVPKELIDQLVIGGRLVIPVGSRWEQDLLQVIKQKEGYTAKNLTPCRFVPLIGEEAWSEE